jgi:hypothetical protein
VILADRTFSARDLHWHDRTIFVKQNSKNCPTNRSISARFDLYYELLCILMYFAAFAAYF